MIESLRVTVRYGNKRVYGHTSLQIYDAIASRAFLLNVKPDFLITACIMFSIADYPSISEESKQIIKQKNDTFNYSCNVVLDILKNHQY